MKNKSNLIISILIPLAVGSISSLLSGNMSQMNYIQPDFTPPAIVFPIVWIILYVLMGISSYIIYESDHQNKSKALRIYGIQLFFNFFWSILFFRFSAYFLSLIWLLVLIILIIIMILRFYKISPIAAYLQIPYLLWCMFASYLNYVVFVLN